MNKELIERLEECERFHYAQSSKVSSLTRTIVYGIVGTIWIIVYSTTSKELQLPCNTLIACVVLCVLYLLFDIVHYFVDAYCYRCESFWLEKDENLLAHEEYMNSISRRSFVMLVIKFGLSLIVAVVFIIGVLQQFRII